MALTLQGGAPDYHEHGYGSVQQEDARKEENLWRVLGNPVRQAEEPDRTSNHADCQREHQGRATQLGYLLRVAAETVSESAGDAKAEDASEKDIPQDHGAQLASPRRGKRARGQNSGRGV